MEILLSHDQISQALADYTGTIYPQYIGGRIGVTLMAIKESANSTPIFTAKITIMG